MPADIRLRQCRYQIGGVAFRMGSGDAGWDDRLTVTGRYYGGLSARRQEVAGRIVDTAAGPSLVIEAIDTGETIANWPGHDIQRLGGDGAPDALGCFGARFQLRWRDGDQRRDFLLRLTKRAQRRIFGLRVLHFVAILVLVVPTLGVLWLGLNGLSVLYVRHIMTDQDWQDIGHDMIDLIGTEIGFCDGDGDGAAAMARLAGRFLDQLEEEAQIDAALARNRNRLRSNLRFRFLDHKLVNAFAVPGDVIVFSRGILAQSDDPDEIAVVLAHELGHHLAGHITEKWRHSQTYGWISLLIPRQCRADPGRLAS